MVSEALLYSSSHEKFWQQTQFLSGKKQQISEHETAAIKQNKKLQSSLPTWPLGEFQPMG